MAASATLIERNPARIGRRKARSAAPATESGTPALSRPIITIFMGANGGIGRGPGFGGQQNQPSVLGPSPLVKPRPAVVLAHGGTVEIIQPGAGQGFGRKREAGRVDDVDGSVQTGAKPDQRARIVGDVGLIERKFD